MAFNEDTRVKIPAILTLTRLGYKYLSLKGANIDEETNIFLDIFAESIKKINSNVSDDDIKRLLQDYLSFYQLENIQKKNLEPNFELLFQMNMRQLMRQ